VFIKEQNDVVKRMSLDAKDIEMRADALFNGAEELSKKNPDNDYEKMRLVEKFADYAVSIEPNPLEKDLIEMLLSAIKKFGLKYK
jgi:hypothetical protein